MKNNRAIILNAQFLARLQVFAVAGPRDENNVDLGALFREMCEVIYQKPVDELTYEELVAVQKALQDQQPEPVVHDLDAVDAGGPTAHTETAWLSGDDALLALALGPVDEFFTPAQVEILEKFDPDFMLSAASVPEEGRSCSHHWPGRGEDEKGWCGRCGLGAKADDEAATSGNHPSASEGEHESGLDHELREMAADTAYATAVNESIAQFGAYATIIGLYWYCTNHHSGQSSEEYRLLSQLGEIFQPGGSANGPEPDSAEMLAYEFFGGTPDDEEGEHDNGLDSDDPHERA